MERNWVREMCFVVVKESVRDKSNTFYWKITQEEISIPGEVITCTGNLYMPCWPRRSCPRAVHIPGWILTAAPARRSCQENFSGTLYLVPFFQLNALTPCISAPHRVSNRLKKVGSLIRQLCLMTLQNPTGMLRAQSNEINPNCDNSYKLEFISWDFP